MTPNAGPIHLPRLSVASPCDESWDAMPGSHRVRHCGKCRQNVYNLSEMTVAQAGALIQHSEGRLCVRMLLRADGTVVTRDCRARLRALRSRGRWGLALFLVLFIPVTLASQLFGWFAAGAARWQPGTRPMGLTAPAALMGEIAEPRPPRALMGDVAGPPQPVMGSPEPLPAMRMGKIAERR